MGLMRRADYVKFITVDEYNKKKAKYEAAGIRYHSFDSWLHTMLDPLCYTGASKVGPMTDDDYPVTITDCDVTTEWTSKVCANAWYKAEIRSPAERIRNRAKRILRLLKAGERVIDAGDGYSA